MIESDTVAGAAGKFAEWIRVGNHRCVKMFSIQGKCQAEEKGLAGAVTQAAVGKIRELVRFKIENRDGLSVFVAVGAETAVQENREEGIGRYGGGGREVVDSPQ